MWKLESSLYSVSEWLLWLSLAAAAAAVVVAALAIRAQRQEDANPISWDTVGRIAIAAACLFAGGELARFAGNHALRSDLRALADQLDSFAASHELPEAPTQGETIRRFASRTRTESHATGREYLDQYADKVRYARAELARRTLSDPELDRFYADATSSVTIHIIAERLQFLAAKL